MENMLQTLVAVIAEKQAEIAELKTQLEKKQADADRYWKWWNEEDKRVEDLKVKVKNLEAQLPGNFIKTSPDA